jgi:glucan phosphoethanolaminetransferase (alkaline phosphatase superfamily)
MSDKEFEKNPDESVTPPVIAKESANKGKLIGIIIAVVVIVVLMIFSLVCLFREDLYTTSKVRDFFIIIMALESLLLGAAFIILIIQIALLINVLKNEIKPILDPTNETINHLRGTTTFLSNNLVEPVIKMNEYTAGLKRFVDILKPSGKSRKSK